MSARRRGESSKERESERQGRRRRTEEAAPWSQRRVAIAHHIARFGKVVSPSSTKTRRSGMDWWRGLCLVKDVQRFIAEGYAERTGKIADGPWLRCTRNYVVLTEKGRTLIDVQPIAHEPNPYAKRRAGLDEFRDANL